MEPYSKNYAIFYCERVLSFLGQGHIIPYIIIPKKQKKIEL